MPYTSIQNGVAERMNLTIFNGVRSMLAESGLSLDFWCEAADSFVYTKNISPCRSLPNDRAYKTPHEIFHGYKPSVKHLRIFGERCWAHVPSEKRSKLDQQSVECIFVGYPAHKKGYRLLTVDGYRLLFSCDVTFSKNPLLFLPRSKEMLESRPNRLNDFSLMNYDENISLPSQNTDINRDVVDQSADNFSPSDNSFVSDDSILNESLHEDDFPTNDSTDSWCGVSSENILSDSRRGVSANLAQLTSMLCLVDPPNPSDYASSSAHDSSALLSTSIKHPATANLARCSSSKDTPYQYKDIAGRPDAQAWYDAVESEDKSLERHETFEIVEELPPGKRALGTRYVFKIRLPLWNC